MINLSLIIPAYNEGSHIFEVLDQAAHRISSYQQQNPQFKGELIVVNDGSIDQTQEEIDKFSKVQLDKYQQLSFHCVSYKDNQGYGAALKHGFAAAKGEYLSFMDGDRTIDAQTVLSLYEQLKSNPNKHMATGQRFSSKSSKMPKVRKLGNVIFAQMLSFLSGKKITDTASGVRVFDREALNKMLPLPNGLHFTPAMSSKAVHENIEVLEVPIDYYDREGKSKLSVVKDGWRFFHVIVSIVMMYNPFKILFLVGMCLIAIGLVFMMPLIQSFYKNEAILFSDYIYRSLGAFSLMVMGTQVILLGILARFIVSTFFKRYEKDWLIQKLNSYLRVYENMTLYGTITLLLGASALTAFFIRYLAIGGLHMHWVVILLSSGFMIVGGQMITSGILMNVLKDIKQALILKEGDEF
ncbi:MAG TPA: glycosyltransferase family 2 protein [Oligoflexia bacterium]|nr:glycosyltransferase family 2 protein [Oligoflexia bacterium]HMR23770.1 glycosyltransferase family 2 protein [Oligoflexia bacterium]